MGINTTWKSGAYAKWYSNDDNKKKVYERVRERKEQLKAWLDDYKKTRTCEDCGNEDHRVLTFHHLRDKKYDVCNMPNRGCSITAMKKEIDKCVVLCANCHVLRHYD